MVTYLCKLICSYRLSGAAYAIKHEYTSTVTAANFGAVKTAFFAEIAALVVALGTGSIYYYQYEWTLVPGT